MGLFCSWVGCIYFGRVLASALKTLLRCVKLGEAARPATADNECNLGEKQATRALLELQKNALVTKPKGSGDASITHDQCCRGEFESPFLVV